MQKSERLQWKTRSGDPVRVGEMIITPQSQSLTLRFPWRWPGGFVWNRPTALLVERDGVTERVLIIDATRLAQAGIVGLAFLFWAIVVLVSYQAGRKS